MIKRVSRKKLDVNKYTECLNKSVNYRIYAEVFYLDALVENNWDCYVLNDYEAIMPLPFVKKIGFKFITQPIYCQQLGVFHQENLSKETFQLFENKLHRNLVRAYSFNEENTEMFEPKGEKRVNQVLDLNFDYNIYFKTIRKNRKQEIKTGLPENYKICQHSKNIDFIDLLDKNYSHIKKELQLKKLVKLVNKLQEEEKSITISIEENQQVLASSFYIISDKRLIQLCNAKVENSPVNLNSFIVHHIIKTNLNKSITLDFEGSSLKGVQEFNESFRAATHYFTCYKNFL
ncbi:hypothetical protein OBK27_08285 [Empedobacter falsenii]